MFGHEEMKFDIMDLKQRILQEASPLLFEMGPVAMTMDMVARSCGISKRTLYGQFPDKKSLIRECMALDHDNTAAEFKKIFDGASNCFEALFGVFSFMRKKLASMHISFHDDIKRLYPDLYCSLHKENDQRRVMGLASVLSNAQNEGLVVEGINTQVASFLFFATIKSLHRNSQIAEYEFTQIDVFDGAFINFLRGVASHKGLELIECYLKKNINNRYK